MKLEIQINELKRQVARLETINKDYEDKLYGKNSHKINDIHVLLRNFNIIFDFTEILRDPLMRMKLLTS